MVFAKLVEVVVIVMLSETKAIIGLERYAVQIKREIEEVVEMAKSSRRYRLSTMEGS